MTRPTTCALAALFTIGNAMAGGDAPVAVNVDGLTPNIAAKVAWHAQQGEKSLAKYLERVRPYQRLTLEDVTTPRAETPQAAIKPREYRRHARDWHQSIYSRVS